LFSVGWLGETKNKQTNKYSQLVSQVNTSIVERAKASQSDRKKRTIVQNQMHYVQISKNRPTPTIIQMQSIITYYYKYVQRGRENLTNSLEVEKTRTNECFNNTGLYE
jgi:hypothetical protein